MNNNVVKPPSWVDDNQYLEILAPRFFENQKSIDWNDLPRRVSRLFLQAEMKYSDISQLLNTSEGALKASYHIAVKKITAFVKSHE